MKHRIDSRLASRLLVPGLLALSGCTSDLGPQPVLPVDPPVGSKVNAIAARPLETGLLSVSPDGAFAVASDDMGEAVYVVTLAAGALTSRTVKLDSGEQPARAALTNTHAYVALPRTGVVVVIELASASVVSRLTPCPSPQGLAIEGAQLHVACRGGELVTSSLDDGSTVRSLLLEDDLKDVAVVSSGLVVSRYAQAELLWLDANGAVLERSRPTVSAGNEAAIAWRTIVAEDGVVFMAHQTDSDQDLGGGYSGGECGSITAPTVTTFAPPGVTPANRPGLESSATVQQINQTSMLAGSGTFDIAATSAEFALVFPGNEFAHRFAGNLSEGEVALPALGEVHPIHYFTIGVDDGFLCMFGGSRLISEPAVPIGIASVAAGPLAGGTLILTHSPAKVRSLNVEGLEVLLHDEDRSSTGLELFQMTVGSGISCASCHPGGRADARTWQLANGPRRTQPLEGGVSHLGAFHWDAEFSTFNDLVDDVMTRRMGLHENLSDAHKGALLGFLDAIPAPPLPAQTLDAEAAARGRALFESPATECSTCHSGPALTNNVSADVGTGGTFVTPSLVGVGYRKPLMHDGCATDLLDRFGRCGGGDLHGKTSQLTDDEITDLVAYMQTL